MIIRIRLRIKVMIMMTSLLPPFPCASPYKGVGGYIHVYIDTYVHHMCDCVRVLAGCSLSVRACEHFSLRLILSLLVRSGVAPRFQLKWVWQRNNANVPVALLLVIAALGASGAFGKPCSVSDMRFVCACDRFGPEPGDSMGDVIGAICTPHVSGPVHSLLSNCTPIFIAALSMCRAQTPACPMRAETCTRCLLHQRYSLWQSLALIGAALSTLSRGSAQCCTVLHSGSREMARSLWLWQLGKRRSRRSRLFALAWSEVIGVLPSFHSGNTSPFFAVVLGGPGRRSVEGSV